MSTHFNNDAERGAVLKRSRLLVTLILSIVVGLAAFCIWNIIHH